jgi:hypothetical protein
MMTMFDISQGCASKGNVGFSETLYLYIEFRRDIALSRHGWTGDHMYPIVHAYIHTSSLRLRDIAVAERRASSGRFRTSDLSRL